MSGIADALAKYGYESLFAVLFLEAIGLPIPGALALLLAGAACAQGTLSVAVALPVAVFALLLGDSLLYLLGRVTGWWLLGVLCRISVHPETCILRSARSFYRRGRTALVFAKFIPGLNSMAPPMAGSMNMRPRDFLMLDFAAALLYSTVYGGAGLLFSGVLKIIIRDLEQAGTVVKWVAAIALIVYIGRRIWLFAKSRADRVVPRITVEALQQLRNRDEVENVLIADVRSHGYYDAAAERILGSIRLEPNNLEQSCDGLAQDKPIYLYCTCYRQATSRRVAHLLRERGFDAYVIDGGLQAWRKAGHPTEMVPQEDVVLLPTFS